MTDLEELQRNPWDATRRAANQARSLFDAVDRVSGDMARLLRGRLRHVNDADALRDLKRELRDFDMVTGTWKQSGG